MVNFLLYLACQGAIFSLFFIPLICAVDLTITNLIRLIEKYTDIDEQTDIVKKKDNDKEPYNGKKTDNRRRTDDRKTFPLEKLPAEIRQMILAKATASIVKVDSTTAYAMSKLPTEATTRREALQKMRKNGILTEKDLAEYTKIQPLRAVSSTIRADMEIVEKQWLRSLPMNLAAFESWLDTPQRDRRETLILAINPRDFFEKPPKGYHKMAEAQYGPITSYSKIAIGCAGWTPYYLRWKEAIRRLPLRTFSKIILCETEEPFPEDPSRWRLMPQGPKLAFETLLLIRTRSFKKDAVVTEYRKVPLSIEKFRVCAAACLVD